MGKLFTNRMAAKVCDSDGRTGFSQPLKNSSTKWQPPPRKHCIAQVTGGLEDIYTKIESGWQNADEDFSKCINEENFFQPNSKGGLLAGRYQVIRILGRGISSTILQAQDTFRPGLYEVAIKVLKPEFYRLGYQESHLIAELNKADSHNFCGIVRLLNTFTLGYFFCMTFELLRPWPLHQVFKKITDKKEKLVLIRKVSLRMLQILGFLGQQNIIHADLKPENILCNSENVSDGIKVIDFGNAIHGVYEELSLYYDEFELQTLLYRAPEVLLGLPFGQEIDIWSLGCILAELYLGKPLFWAKQKKELLSQMTSLFGPLPTKVYQRAKFFTQFKEAVGQPLSFMDRFSKFGSKLDCNDFKFVSFLQGILTFDPSERMSVSEAIQHPFMGPELAIRYVLPFKINGSEASSTYPAVDMTPSMYTHAPAGTLDSKNKHLTSLELLHHGTRDTNTTKQKVIHVVAPFEPSKSEDMKNAGIKAEPKSEPGEDVEHGERMSDIQLPEAFRETIKNPIARSVPELMEQGVAVDSKASDRHLPHKPLPSKHTLKQSMQSLKVKQNSVVSQQVVEVESDSKPCHANGKGEYKSEPRKHIVTPPKDYFSHQQTLKESKDSAGRSELKISGKTTSAPDVKTTCASGSTGKADHQFRYLNQQKKEAVTHKSKSLGINMKRLRKSPVKKLVEEIPVSYSKRKYGKRRKKSDASSNEKKSDISLASKGMLICDDKKSVHPRKDVTLMVDKDQQKRIPMESNNLKGNHSTSSTSSTGHKHSKHEDGTSIYEIIITPEKKKKHRSRKRSLQIIDDSVVKRTRTKRTTSEMIEMKVVDDSQGSTEKCSLESLNSPSSSMKQSEAGLSSSESSTEQTSLQSKMHFLSRLQVAGDNKSVKLSLSSLSGTPTSSLSTKSSLQSFMRRSLESSPLPEQLTKTALTSSERKTDAKIVHEHSIGRNKLMQRDIPLLSSSSPSSATSSSPDLIPSSLYPLSSSNSHPSQLVTKQTSPALQIKKLFGGSSSRDSSTPQESVTVAPRQQRKHSSQQRVKASSIQHRKSSPKEQRTASHMQQRKSTTMKWRRVSPKQERKASPKQERKASPKVPKKLSPMKQRKVSSNVQGQIIDIKATEAERQDSPSDDDDEILLL